MNMISSKVDKQIFFWCYRQNRWWRDKKYLQNLTNLIFTENTNKTQEIRPTQYSTTKYLMDLKKFKNS